MAMEPQLGVEIFEFSDLGGTGQLGVLIVVSVPNYRLDPYIPVVPHVAAPAAIREDIRPC
jgi:hypothetical protein